MYKTENFNDWLFGDLSEDLKKTNTPFYKPLSNGLSYSKNWLRRNSKKYFQYVKNNIADKGWFYSWVYSSLSGIPVSAAIYSTAISTYLTNNDLFPYFFAGYVLSRIPVGIAEEWMVRKQRKEGKAGMTSDAFSNVFGPMTKTAWDIVTKTVGLLSDNPILVAGACIKTYADLIGNVPRVANDAAIILGRKAGVDKKLRKLYERINGPKYEDYLSKFAKEKLNTLSQKLTRFSEKNRERI